jgi:hypothetical protein
MRILTIRKAAVAVVLPLALGSLAACGSSDGSSTAADPAASTTSPTADASTRSGSTDTAGQTIDSGDFLALVKAGAQ